MNNRYWTAIFAFLTFRRMASPVLLQLLFWAGIAGTLFGTYVLWKLDNWAWPIPLLLGPILVRVIFERAIIAFRTYEDIHSIRAAIEDRR